MRNTPTKEFTQEAQIFDGYEEIISAIHTSCSAVLYESFFSAAAFALLCQVVPLRRLAMGSIVVLIRFSELLCCGLASYSQGLRLHDARSSE
jgi:hypothetical protein